MSEPQAFSAEQGRLAEVERLVAQGAAGVPGLVGRLAEPSWVVRRQVIAALARLGPAAVGPLCEVLRAQRDSEARLAAAVDALSAASGDIDPAVLELAAGDPRPAVICDAVAILGRRRSARATPTLARLTQHADDNVAVAAIEALGRVGGAAAVDALVATVGARHFFRTFPALDVLGRSGQGAAIAPLSALLDDPLYAPEAARALGHTADERAVGHLVPLLGRGGDALSRVAALALGELDERLRQRGATGAVAQAVAAAGLDAAAVEHLAQTARAATPEEQPALCRILGWVGTDVATAALLELLERMPSAVAAALRHAGGNPRLLEAVRGGESAQRAVLLPLLRSVPGAAAEALRCLDDPDPSVRTLACDLLARASEVAAVPALFERLGDPDPGVVQAAVGALQSLGSDQTEPRALEAARSSLPRVRHAALRLLGFFGFPSALPALLEAARGPDERAGEIALGGLALQEDPRALDALVAAAQHGSARLRAAGLRALGQGAVEPKSSAVLRAALGDPDPWLRYYACQALGRRREQDAVPALLPLLDDPAGQVHVAVIDALSHLGGAEATRALYGAARSADPDVRRAAFLGLGASQHAEALPLLVEAAAAPESATRLAAVAALGAFDGPGVVPVLARLAGDADGDVASSAVGFLSERAGPAASTALVSLLPSSTHGERLDEALRQPRPGRFSAVLAGLQQASEPAAPLLAAILASRSHPESEGGLLATLAFGNGAARRATAAVLVGAASPEARASLERAAELDPDPEVRRLATRALSQP